MIILRNKNFTCAARRGALKKANLKYGLKLLPSLEQTALEPGSRRGLRGVVAGLKRGGQRNISNSLNNIEGIADRVQARHTIKNIREAARNIQNGTQNGLSKAVDGMGKNTIAVQNKRSLNAARRQALQEGLI